MYDRDTDQRPRHKYTVVGLFEAKGFVDHVWTPCGVSAYELVCQERGIQPIAIIAVFPGWLDRVA